MPCASAAIASRRPPWLYDRVRWSTFMRGSAGAGEVPGMRPNAVRQRAWRTNGFPWRISCRPEPDSRSGRSIEDGPGQACGMDTGVCKGDCHQELGSSGTAASSAFPAARVTANTNSNGRSPRSDTHRCSGLAAGIGNEPRFHRWTMAEFARSGRISGKPGNRDGTSSAGKKPNDGCSVGFRQREQ